MALDDPGRGGRQLLLAALRGRRRRYRLTYEPPTVVPVEDWLRPQKRFAHLLRPENAEIVEEIQRRVDSRLAVTAKPLRARRRSGVGGGPCESA